MDQIHGVTQIKKELLETVVTLNLMAKLFRFSTYCTIHNNKNQMIVVLLKFTTVTVNKSILRHYFLITFKSKHVKCKTGRRVPEESLSIINVIKL